MKPALNIGIAWRQKDYPGQTFIKAHSLYLPGNITVFHGGGFPEFFPSHYNSQPIYSKTDILWLRASYKIFRIPTLPFRSHKVARLFHQQKLDVLLAEFGSSGALFVEFCKKAKLPLVVHFHGADAYSQSVLSRYKDRYEILFQYAKAIVVVSSDMQQHLKRMGAPPEKIYCNPYGVDGTIFCGADPRQAPPLFLGVARFVEKKGQAITIRAFREVLNRFPQAELVFIGDGPLLEPCRLLCQELKISDSVKFVGYATPAEVVAWMKRARALVQHSIRAADGDAEGTPVSILEAGSCGLPVVATRHMGISEAVLHEKTGFLVEEGAVDTMAEYMLQLIQNPGLSADLGKNARAWIEKNYSQEKSINNLYQILLEASRGKPRGA